MSLVIVVGNKNFILFGSDTRLTSTNIHSKKVEINNNYRKVFKINKNCLIGIAGDKDYCMHIIETLIDGKMTLKEKHNLSFNQIDKFIHKRFKCLLKTIELEPDKYRKAKAYIVVGGINEGILNLNSYFYEEENLEISRLVLDSERPNIVTLSSGKYDHKKYYIEKFSINPLVEVENLKNVFSNTLKNGAKYDSSINDSCDFVQIIL